MQTPEPQTEHQWLHQLVGQWTIESECVMGPDQPPLKLTGRENVRLLGQFWTIGEGSSDTPEGGCDSIMTLGFDPLTKMFVGTFVASAMTHLWPYRGSLDTSRRILTLDSEGPSFTGEGTMSKYQDIIEFISPDHRTLTAQVQNADGLWQRFMVSHYHRVK